MSNCNYSIVPKPGKTIICSKCGKKIEDLPYYTQVAKMYTCILKKNNTRFYVGLGLGVPMCDDCDENVEQTIEHTNNRYRNTYLIGGFVVMLLLGILRSSAISAGLILPLVAVGIGLVILINLNDKEKQSTINDKLQDSGLGVVKGIMDYLKKNGWKQGIDERQEARDYTEESLKLDLDKLCGGGIYCVLDNGTGRFVDHRDPETLKEIYGGSLWRYKE